MTFKLRKLCSSTEEYEANASGPVDLDLFASHLSQRPGVELSRYETILTILFEEEGVVVRLFSSGKSMIQASFRKDAELVYTILTEVSNNILSKDNGERPCQM